MKKCPFPQANNMQLVYNIFFDIGPDGLQKFQVSEKYGLKDRQGSYYLDALLYLGLVEKISIKYFLTPKGVQLRMLATDDIKDGLCKIMLDDPFLSKMYETTSLIDDKKERKTYLASCIENKFALNGNTSKRRASTINSWFEWIKDNIKEK